MFDRVVIATDGSRSVERAVEVGLDLADRFEAAVHAVYVIDENELEAAPATVRADLERELARRGDTALDRVAETSPGEIVAAVREGSPPAQINRYAKEIDADLVVTGTRGRHGEGELLLGSVAERVVRTCSMAVLTVRQLDDAE